MPSDHAASGRARLALLAIRDNVSLARSFVEEMSEEAFRKDRRTFYAVTRCLEIISEAARRLSPAVRDRHPALPWRAIMGVGNIYRHDYDNVSEALVWRTVRHGLAQLLRVVEDEIALSEAGTTPDDR